MASRNYSASGEGESSLKEFINQGNDHAEVRSVSSKQRLRTQLQQEIEDFISRGGEIRQIDPSITADPPKKPSGNYGSQPI